ncbi:MAG: type II CAAX endopeptidase family protein [Candidatus Micrarchaeota archaeon]|nr:CPBP family intramembrane metalloprotease [Candidatus Micrarchaeota archaeon]MBU1886822.1 CPBP family intramembrane metalloprotease [Candidatus Micrarchaeota archaeon]
MKSFFILFLIFAIIIAIISITSMFLGDVYNYSIPGLEVIRYLFSFSIHIALFSVAMIFLWKDKLSSTLISLGVPGKIGNNIEYTLAGLFSIFVLLLVFGIIANALGFNDQENVTDKVNSLPFYLLIFAVLVAPITEELFFRAFLVPRVGIIFSSLLFGVLHASYGSVVEIIGAGVIGMVLAVVFKDSKSITPCIAIHMLYNLVSIIVMKLII